MADRKPIVLVNGRVQQHAAPDTLIVNGRVGVGGIVYWTSSAAPAVAGDLGMSVLTGRPSAFIDGAVHSLAHVDEVLDLGTTIMASQVFG